MGTPKRVAQWLTEVNLLGSVEKEQEHISLEHVTTPERPSRVQLSNAISPGDSTFSGRTIFDSPLKPDVDSPFSDSSSVTTCICDNDLHLAKGQHVETKSIIVDSIENAGKCSSAASVTSYDPPSEPEDNEANIKDAPKIQTTIIPHDPNKPYFVCVLSCLQCVLAGLPCSRTVPSCTRCVRHDRGSSCLLQRRKTMKEVQSAGLLTRCNAPVLLRLTYEDEEVRRMKDELAEELLGEWREKEDAKNWVLPDVHLSPRKSFSRRSFVNKRTGHPGEGIGRVKFADLCFEAEHVVSPDT